MAQEANHVITKVFNILVSSLVIKKIFSTCAPPTQFFCSSVVFCNDDGISLNLIYENPTHILVF